MVPPHSHRISRVRWYSGYRLLSFRFVYRTLTFFGQLSHTVRLQINIDYAVLTPNVLLHWVWPLPLSLATTRGISVDFSSSGYLDVSVPRVPFLNLCIQLRILDSSPRWFPNSEICGYNGYLLLPAAYRSLSRPSSAPDAKAFALCSCSLEQSSNYLSLFSSFLNCLSSRSENC